MVGFYPLKNWMSTLGSRQKASHSMSHGSVDSYNLSWLFSVIPSFREMRGLLLLSHISNFISEEVIFSVLLGTSLCQLVFSTLFIWRV